MSPLTRPGARCVLCGGEVIQHNHVGGKHHIAWFTMPLCVPHHSQFHDLVRAAGIDLTHTDDPRERLMRAQKACLVFQWMLSEALGELNSKVTNEEQNISA